MYNRIVVLTSGGIDSNVLLARALKRCHEVYPVYIRAGLVWERAELYWLKRFLGRIKNRRLMPLMILDLPFRDLLPGGWAITGKKTPGYFSRDEEVELTGRNLLLLSKAAVFCAIKRIPVIAIGSLAGNPFPDATSSFFRGFGRVASQALGRPIRVTAPFLDLKKREVLQKGEDLPLHLSFSCLRPKGLKPCGNCNKCAERKAVAAHRQP